MSTANDHDPAEAVSLVVSAQPKASLLTPESVEHALNTVQDLCERYRITALEDFLESCRRFAAEKTLSVAILGRFKAGKSSFLNHLIGRDILPVGAIPVTTVVTELEYGPEDRVAVRFLDSRSEEVELDRIRDFVSEAENPENDKRVERVRVELPAFEPYRGIARQRNRKGTT